MKFQLLALLSSLVCETPLLVGAQIDGLVKEAKRGAVVPGSPVE